MLRNDSGTDIRYLHIDALIQTRRDIQVVQRHQPDGSINLELLIQTKGTTDNVIHHTLYVELSPLFPQVPPAVTTTTGRPLRVAAVGDAWSPELSVLVEAVHHSIEHLLQLWGLLQPPTMASLLPSLQHLSDEALEDICRNPHCLETFAYQLPFSKQAREGTKNLVDTVEAEVLRVSGLNTQLLALETERDELRQVIMRHMEVLREKKDAVDDLIAIGTVDGVAKAFAKEAKLIQLKSDEVEKQLLAVSPADDGAKGRLEQLKEELLQLRIQFHNKELRRRALLASQQPVARQ